MGIKHTKKSLNVDVNSLFEALAFGDEEVTLQTSSVSDPDIQRIIKFYATSTGITHQQAEDELIIDMTKQIAYLSKSPEINKNAIDNAAASAAFQLMEKVDLDNVSWKTLGVEPDELLDGDMFYDLTEYIIRENPTFYPLRNPFENKSIKPFFYIAPDDIFLMNDPALEHYSQGDFTAFCTPTAQIVFNRKFSERMCMYSLLTDAKPKSKKYVSNGGDIPDHYEYIEFIIVHELLHYTAGDHFYTKAMVRKIMKKYPGVSESLAHKILNYVGDYINNWTLLKSGYSQLPIGLFSEDLNYDKMETYEDIIDAVVEEFEQMSGKDLSNMMSSLDAQMDDHQGSADEAPSQGGAEGTPQNDPNSSDPGDEPGGDGQGGSGETGISAEGDPGESGSGGEAGSGKEAGEKDKSSEDGSGTGKGDGQDGSGGGKGGGGGGAPKGTQGADENQTEQDKADQEIADAIDKANKENQEKMNNRDDGNTTNDTSDILNGQHQGSQVKSARDAAKASVGDGGASVDTSFSNHPINWKKVLKKMIPAPTEEMEDCYNKMSRDSTSAIVSAASTGSARIKPGECPDDPDKKGLCIIIDNSGSVSNILSGFNKEIIKLLLDKKNKKMLDNFYVIKFSSDYTSFKVDVDKGTFQKVPDIRKIFKKDGKKIDMKPKLVGAALPIKTKLFDKTFAGGTDYTNELHFVINALHKANFNIILFTDDDLTRGQDNVRNLKKFYALGNKRKGSCAVFLTDMDSYNRMGKTFGKPKWVTALT